MSIIGYEHENSLNYLTILSEGRDHSAYQLKMLIKNRIPGLLDMSIRSINNEIYYYYDITSKKQMMKLYQIGKIQWQDIVMICKSIDKVITSVDEYMLDLDSVMLSPEYMYVNMAEKRICYVYNPDQIGDFDEMLKELFEFILEHYEHGKDQKNLMRVYEIYQKIADGEYDFSHFSALVEESPEDKILYFTPEKESSVVLEDIPAETVTSETEQEPKNWIPLFTAAKAGLMLCIIYAAAALFFPEKVWFNMSAFVCVFIILAGSASVVQLNKYQRKRQKIGEVVEIAEKKPYSFEKSEKQEEREAEVMEEVVCEERAQESENTILLSDYLKKKESFGKLTLVRLNHEELENPYDQWIQISEFPCIIGNMDTYCNIVIQNELISRIHACIYREQETYYLEDMNSTNGTFLNEERILPQSRHLLCHGDILRLANITYKVEKN